RQPHRHQWRVDACAVAKDSIGSATDGFSLHAPAVCGSDFSRDAFAFECSCSIAHTARIAAEAAPTGPDSAGGKLVESFRRILAGRLFLQEYVQWTRFIPAPRKPSTACCLTA